MLHKSLHRRFIRHFFCFTKAILRETIIIQLRAKLDKQNLILEMISHTVHNLQEGFRTEQHQQMTGLLRNIKK